MPRHQHTIIHKPHLPITVMAVVDIIAGKEVGMTIGAGVMAVAMGGTMMTTMIN